MFIQQTKAIFQKNWLLTKRNKSEILKEIAVPFISALVLVASNYKEQMKGSFLDMMLPIYLPAAITGFSRRHLITFVQEKQEKFKESQKIMGLTQKAYICGWLLFSYIKIIWVFIITVGTIYFFSGMYNEETFVNLVFSFSLYLIASVHQTFAISPFFNDPKFAGEIGTFIMTLASLLYFLIVFQFQGSNFAFIITCLIPQPAISFAIMENNSPFASLNQSIDPILARNILIFDVFLYLALYVYFDEVFPNEYGIQQHPLFCLKPAFLKQQFQDFKSIFSKNQITEYKNKKKYKEENYRGSQFSSFQNEKIQDCDEEVMMLEMQGDIKFRQNEYLKQENGDQNNREIEQTAEITDLRKNFGNLKAVNGLSFNLYQNEIFCLLGHNGSGKTTTISLLSGILQKSSGSIKIFGKSLEENLGYIRQKMGICSQKDILYDELTCEEQLRFIGDMKGIPQEILDKEVAYILKKVNLYDDHRLKQVQHLSGGNKRKLSLGCAIIGNSKLVFLDEPTSGMDPVSRRAIWDILQEIKQEGRTIILTTHHLDEAEVLASRIGILSQGSLLVLGTSETIKKNFGIGYHLLITQGDKIKNSKFNNADQQKLKQIINEYIPEAKLHPQSQNTCMRFVLPFNQQNQYSELFKQIEKVNQNLILNLEMNSLEEAFINIGLDSLEENNQQEVNSNLPLNGLEFSNKLPEALKIKPKAIFLNQMFAMAQREFYLLTRDWAIVMMLLLPLLFIYLGIMVGKNILTILGDAGDGLKIFFVTIFIVQAYCLNCSIFINTLVMERELQLKYVMNVMGMKALPYYIGTFITDYLIYLVTVLFFYIITISNDVPFLHKHLTVITLILAVFGLSLISFTYICSFFYTKSNSAFKSFPMVSFFGLYSIPWIFLNILHDQTFLLSICKLIVYVISPFKVLENCLTSVNADFDLMSGKMGQQQNLNNQDDDNEANSYEFYLFVLFSQFILYFYLIFKLENKYGKQTQIENNKNNKLLPQQDNENASVQQEKERVFHVYNEDKIKAQKLYKIYPNGFKALQGTTFGVEKGQIFGLLGPNGSGKSTTFNTITGNIPKTNGKVLLKDQEIGQIDNFDDMGICPQIDTLWNFLTAKEHLNIFGRIKGLEKQDLQDTVKYYLQTMQLDQDFTQSKAMHLSGGNKRKLCVANSLICGPSLQFFDEPSTGLDPIAKRYLWNCLSKNLKDQNSSIVLTTHSLPEAESLCHKIGILINGKFECLDNLQNLKNEFGNGIQLQLKIKNESDKTTIFNLIQRSFKDCELLQDQITNNANNQVEQEQEKLIMRIRLPLKGYKLSTVFDLLHNVLKDRLKIIYDFSIGQQNLEQIFIQLSKKQKNQQGIPDQQQK